MITLLAFIVAAQFQAERIPDAAGVASRVGSVEAAASALADRTHDLRRELPSTPPEIIERADLVAPGKLRLYASPIRFERDGQYLPIQLAWVPGKTTVMECATNTLVTSIGKDGWKRVSGKGWRLSTRPVDADSITVKRTDADVLEVWGLWPDGAVTEYRLMRGGVKESIVLERAPESAVWTYDAKLDGATQLELGKGGTQVLVKADDVVAGILPTPIAIDASGKRCTGTYVLAGAVLSTLFPHEWFRDAKYPVVVDPTTTEDVDLCVSIRSGGSDYRRSLLKFPLPSIAGTVTAAVCKLYLSNNAITSATIDLLSSTTDTADWTSGTSAATLDGYTYTATLDTVSFTNASSTGWHEWDVLGSVGTEQAIADAYDDGDPPVNWTVRIWKQASGTTVAEDTSLIVFGDDAGSDYLEFDGPSTANVPYIELTYTADSTGARGSGSVGIIGL